MKIQLVLSGTYLCQGKVYQRKGADGQPLTYTVSKEIGDHLLAQRSERDIPYFRMVAEDTPAVEPAEKRVEKGGTPKPESKAKPKPAEEPTAQDSEPAEEELTPQQKAARTRAANKAKKEAEAAAASEEAGEDEDVVAL